MSMKIEHTNISGWESAVRGMRNPMNSWDRSDTDFRHYLDTFEYDVPKLGTNDYKLMIQLAKSGTADHRKYLRMITVYADIIAPLYWWKEQSTYKVGTVENSCSTMHKIASKEFTTDDFSFEKLYDITENVFIAKRSESESDSDILTNMNMSPKDWSYLTVELLNVYRDKYLKTRSKEDWWQLIQMLPSSYNQKRTVMLNYEVLRNMYTSRKNHKLDEWRQFCDWIESLPYSEFITQEY